jgi:hypothetical protein
MTDNLEVLDWMQQARNLRCTHVIVVRQGTAEVHTPVFVRFGEDATAKAKQYNGVNGQVVVEIIPIAPR